MNPTKIITKTDVKLKIDGLYENMTDNYLESLEDELASWVENYFNINFNNIDDEVLEWVEIMQNYGYNDDEIKEILYNNSSVQLGGIYNLDGHISSFIVGEGEVCLNCYLTPEEIEVYGSDYYYINCDYDVFWLTVDVSDLPSPEPTKDKTETEKTIKKIDSIIEELRNINDSDIKEKSRCNVIKLGERPIKNSSGKIKVKTLDEINKNTMKHRDINNKIVMNRYGLKRGY